MCDDKNDLHERCRRRRTFPTAILDEYRALGTSGMAVSSFGGLVVLCLWLETLILGTA
jgi:hypothetical protein